MLWAEPCASWGTPEKKSYRYRERDEGKRQEYREQLATIDPSQVLYLDEAGINDNESYPGRGQLKENGLRMRNQADEVKGTA